VENKGKTGAARDDNTLVVERLAAAEVERVAVSGTLAAGAAPQVVHRSVVEPGLYAAAVLRLQLAANDIAVAGGVRRAPAPPGAHVLMQFQGKPLGEVVRLLMKYSNNGIAEALCKGLGTQASGGPGSWSTGLAAIRRHLGQSGIDTASFTLLDGSGLSPGNRVSPRGLVTVLQKAHGSFAFGPELIAALPIAGLDGTLQQRGSTVTAKVRAKTGLLTGAVGLSGYARLVDGEEAIFSVLINDHDSGAADAMTAIDRFVAALVTSSWRSSAGRSSHP
jgi:D-alanyl-D-alanine carboxypeptidase/D-alanyl-D-alanine-endopeptidase (penicillin-binding protein 4)